MIKIPKNKYEAEVMARAIKIEENNTFDVDDFQRLLSECGLNG